MMPTIILMMMMMSLLLLTIVYRSRGGQWWIFDEPLNGLRGKYPPLSTTQRRVTVLVYTTQIPKELVNLLQYTRKLTVEARLCLSSCSEVSSTGQWPPNKPIKAREKYYSPLRYILKRDTAIFLTTISSNVVDLPICRCRLLTQCLYQLSDKCDDQHLCRQEYRPR